MQRRTFLATTAASVGGLLADRLPGRQFLVDGESLDVMAKAVSELRYLEGRDGSASVLMPGSWLAGRLTQALATMRPQHEQYSALASLTADATELAGWIAFETGEYRGALRWYDLAIDAARKAKDPNFLAFAGEARARVLALGLEDTEAALIQLSRIKLDPLIPNLRAHVHVCRARVLAIRGDERATNRAIDAALDAEAQAASRAWARDSRALQWITSPGNKQIGRALALADLGYGEVAHDLLTASIRQLPPSRRRLIGTVHRGLAQAAILIDEPVKAAKHIATAHAIFTATGSRQLGVLNAVTADLKARYGDVRAVRELDERLRTDTRYVLCRTSDEGMRIHLRTCRYARRGRARPWVAGERLDPAELARSHLSSGYDLCERCCGSRQST